MKKKEKEEALRKALQDPKMLAKLGEAMAAPIRNALNMNSMMRSFVSEVPLEVLTAEEEEEERISRKPW